MRCLHTPAVLAALICSCGALAQQHEAASACQVQATTYLDSYTVSRGARGLISIQVNCPDTGHYVLHIQSGATLLNGPEATLVLSSMFGEGTPARVRITGLPLPEPFNGIRRVDLPLWAAPGQWSLSSGQYVVPVVVNVNSTESGDLP